MNEPESSRVLTVLRAIVLAGLLIYFAFYLFHAWQAVTFPYDLDNGEAFVLWDAMTMASGSLPYQPLSHEPWIVSNYTPLYPALLALPVKFFGISFAWGRGLSVLAALGTGLFLSAIVYRFSGDRTASAIAGLFFFSTYYIYEWTPFHRVDSLALFFTVLGLWLAGRNGNALWCVPAFVAALLTRQTMIFAPLTVFFYLLARHERRNAWLVLILTGGITGLICILLNILTNEEFIRHVIVYNTNRFYWEFVYNFLKAFFRQYAIVGGLGLFYLAWSVHLRRVDLPVLYLIFAGLSTLMCGKIGAASNYLFELTAALCLCLGFVLSEASRSYGSEGRALQILLYALLIIQIAAIIHIPRVIDFAPTPNAADIESGKRLSQIIRMAKGKVLAEDAGYLLLNHKPVPIQPFVLTQLAEEGRWDPEPFLRNIRERRYERVILTFDTGRVEYTERFSREMIKAIKDNYQAVDGIAGPQRWWGYWIYEPKAAS